MSLSPVSNVLIKFDTFAGYVPVVSTGINLLDIALKIVLSIASKKFNITNKYLKYLHNKSYSTCLYQLVPIVAQISLIINQVKAHNLYKRALKETDPEKAFNLFAEATERGHAKAKIKFIECHLYGKGIPKDEPLAITCLQELIEEENGSGYALMGICYENGTGVEVDADKAFELYTKAAALKDPLGMYLLGLSFYKGMGTEKNPVEAFKYFTKAFQANPENADAAYMLATCYYEGSGIEKDEDKSLFYYEKGDSLGSIDCKYFAGYIYLFSEGPKKDLNKGFQLMQETISANPNHSNALNTLGRCYEDGLGTSIDLSEAENCYQRAANLGEDGPTELSDPDAICSLGLFKLKGKNGPVDLAAAKKYFEWAAQAGSEKADEELKKLAAN